MTDTASISIGDLAAHLGVSRDLLYDQVRAGRLPVVLVGGHQRVRLEDVDDWVERQRMKKPAPPEG